MKMSAVQRAAMIVLAVACAGSASAQSDGSLPVAGYDAARDVPGAHEKPDPSLTYKVVFDIARGASKPEEINPGLEAIARYVNTLAKSGVSADHRKIAVVFHQGSTDIVMNSDTFKSRYKGQDNPNIALIHALKQAGVDFRVCGQALLGRKIDPKTVLPDIQVDLWALTTLVNLELRGYVRVGS
jgi:intracellular sulfur oxidation DsrE/DsrF family protein